MKKLTGRERIRVCLNHEEPDRVPTALWGGPYGLVDEFYLKLVEHLQLGAPVRPFRSGHNVSYMDDRVLERLEIDTRYVWPGDSPSSPNIPTGHPDRFLDGYGQAWIYRAPYFFAGGPILAEATVNSLDDLARWPDVNDPRWTAGVAERARMLHEGTDCCVVARMVVSHGPFQTASNLRGSEQFFVDMGENPEFVLLLIERVTDIMTGLLKNYLAACGPYIDMIELPGDDYATTKGLIFSPRMFRRYIKPALRRLVDVVKNYRSDIKVMAHSDGVIAPLLQEYIDLGVDVIHPLEPLPAVDLEAIKRQFGEQIGFLGGIDIVHALPGSRDDVLVEVKTRIRQLAPGGGYILAPANHIQVDVPVENLAALFQAAREFGAYPLQ